MDLSVAKTIKQQLTYGYHNSVRVMSWGATNWVGGENFLMFSVNGHKHKGKVKIIYRPFPDVYRVEFYKRGQTEVCHTLDEVYFDELNEKIDAYVEKQDDYSF